MKLAYKEDPLPKYIAVEGPIGVGKTTLANKLAKSFNYDILLCLLYTSPSPRDYAASRMPSSA